MITIKQKNILKMSFCLLLITGGFSYKKLSAHEDPAVAMSLSVSSDAKHAISIHHGKQLVLWDMESKTSKIISNNANIYSAYFIPETNKFIWQDVTTSTVHIENINSKKIKKFNPGFKSYGHSISKNLKSYVASDKNWNLFNVIGDKKKQFKKGFNDFYNGKIFNLSTFKNILLTSGICDDPLDNQPISAGATARDVNPNIRKHVNRSLMNCIVLWNYKTGKALFKLNGNSIKTHATLSPDGKYVASGDENGLGFVWNAKTGERVNKQDNLSFGKILYDKKGRHYFDKSRLISRPKDFCYKYSDTSNDCIYRSTVFAVKFINNDQFLRFITHVPYAILYDVLDPAHKKYLKLEGEPSIHGYNEAALISTAPNKNTLVMAANETEGIRVYQFDREKETLTLVWAPDEIQKTFRQKVLRLWHKIIA